MFLVHIFLFCIITLYDVVAQNIWTLANNGLTFIEGKIVFFQ